jgi:hypothetical protein
VVGSCVSLPLLPSVEKAKAACSNRVLRSLSEPLIDGSLGGARAGTISTLRPLARGCVSFKVESLGNAALDPWLFDMDVFIRLLPHNQYFWNAAVVKKITKEIRLSRDLDQERGDEGLKRGMTGYLDACFIRFLQCGQPMPSFA